MKSRAIPRVAVASVVLVLAVAVAYWPVRDLPFLPYDDPGYVTANSTVQGGLSLDVVRYAFTTFDHANWHPLTWLSHALDCQLFGLSPVGPHLVNVALHAVNAVLLFLLLARNTRALAASFTVSALFALHPCHVESVAWISERKDVLCSLFWLLSLVSWAEWTRTKQRRLYVGSLAACVLAVLAKPMAVTLPFTLLLLDQWPLGRIDGQSFSEWGRSLFLRAREKVPFFVVTLLPIVLTVVAQSRAGAVSSLEGIPFGMRLAHAVVAYGKYLLKLVWPDPLSAYYPLPERLPAWLVVGCLAGLLGVTVILYRLRRAPGPWVGWLFFLGTLVPVIGFVQVGRQDIADRYTYFPSIGFFIVIVFGVSAVLGSRVRTPVVTIGLGVLGVAVLGLHLRATRLYLRFWVSNDMLFQHALEVHDGFHHFARLQLGGSMMNQGRLAEAGAHYAEVLRNVPNDAEAHAGLEEAMRRSRGPVDRLRETLEKIARDPNDPSLRSRAAMLLMQENRADDAIEQFREALRLAPNVVSYLNLGNALMSRGDFAEAQRSFEKAIVLEPNNPSVLLNLGIVHARAGRVSDSERWFRKVLEVAPENADAHSSLGVLFAQSGRNQDAIVEFAWVVRKVPSDVNARVNLALAYVEAGDTAKAVGALGELDAIAKANADAGRWGEAVNVTQVAAQLAHTLGLEDRSRALVDRQVRWYSDHLDDARRLR